MASYIVQGKNIPITGFLLYLSDAKSKYVLLFFSFKIASCGDYVAEDYPDHTYLSSYRFVPHQDASMQRRIMENHKKHV